MYKYFKATRREDRRYGVSEAGTGVQETLERLASGQLRADYAERSPPKEMREGGEIKKLGD